MAAVNNQVLVLDLDYGQELHKFTPFENVEQLNESESQIDLMKITNGDTVWAGSRQSFNLVKLRFIERDCLVVHLCDDRKDSNESTNGLQALNVVNDTVLAATSSKIFVLNKDDGSRLAILEFEQFCSGTVKKVMNALRWAVLRNAFKMFSSASLCMNPCSPVISISARPKQGAFYNTEQYRREHIFNEACPRLYVTARLF